MNEEALRNTIGYFDEAANQWTAKYAATGGHFRTRLETVLRWLEEEARRRPAATDTLKLLDFGCGSGVFMLALLHQGFHVTGVDGSPGMILSASKQLSDTPYLEVADYQLEQISPETFDGRYREKTYGAVFCMGVAEYVDDPSLLFHRLASVLEPGGILICSVPNRESLLRKVEGYVHTHPERFRGMKLFQHLTGPDSYLHFQKHQFTLEELSRNFALYGLRPERTFYHVAPGKLGAMAQHPAIGMTLIAQFRKQ